MLVTGAMDSIVRCWIPEEGSSSFVSLDSAIVYDHEHWVTALIALPPNIFSDCPNGGFVTGSMDRRIRMYDLNGHLVKQLTGHEGGVISLGMSPNGILLSGSWDGTARVWDLNKSQCLHVLAGHENGVCVLGLPDGTIVTGSTGQQVGNTVVDFQLRFWVNGKLERTLADHAGPIRQLAIVPEMGFVSCSNDGSIKFRTWDGDVLASMSHPVNAEGKPGFVLGIAVLADKRIVSVSEDCTARIWRTDGTLLQTIEHPGGLWCVTALANGDFVTGCDDKIGRVFSEATERASEAARASLQKAVEEARLVRQRGPNGVEIDKLPDYNRRIEIQGNSDGQVQMFQREGKAWACQWSGPSRTWIDIGEVTGTGSGGVVDGKAYDMVIPVEIEQPGGVRKLEIGYNQGENPFMVAQEFINKHMLDQSYLKEIADYISQRASDYQAPVISSEEPTASSSKGNNTVLAPYKFFPAAGYNTFEATKIGKLLSALQQFNSAVDKDDMKLSDAELNTLEQTIRTVQDTAFYHSSSFTLVEVEVLMKMVIHWSAEKVFPALDLVRLVMVHPAGPKSFGTLRLDTLISRILSFQAVSSSEQIPTTTRMLGLRVLVNMFLIDDARKAVMSRKSEVLESLATCVQIKQKMVAVSLATLLLNFSFTGFQNPVALTKDEAIVVGSVAFELLNSTKNLEEIGDDTILRAFVCIGTLALSNHSAVLESERMNLDVFSAVHGANMTSPVVLECYRELSKLLQAQNCQQ